MADGFRLEARTCTAGTAPSFSSFAVVRVFWDTYRDAGNVGMPGLRDCIMMADAPIAKGGGNFRSKKCLCDPTFPK